MGTRSLLETSHLHHTGCVIFSSLILSEAAAIPYWQASCGEAGLKGYQGFYSRPRLDSLASVVIAGALEGENIDFILPTSHLLLSPSIARVSAFLHLSPVLAIMTAIHIEFLYSTKVIKMRHRRAGCKSREVAVHEEQNSTGENRGWAPMRWASWPGDLLPVCCVCESLLYWEDLLKSFILTILCMLCLLRNFFFWNFIICDNKPTHWFNSSQENLRGHHSWKRMCKTWETAGR